MDKHIWYDSSYELRALKIMEDDFDIEDFDRCSVTVKYTHDGESKTYYPDFEIDYVDGTSKIIEVKPEALLGHPVTKKKARSLRNWCTKNDVDFEFWCEDELGLKIF